MFDDIKKEILAELRRGTNGAVVGSMFEMIGNEEFMSFGVAVADIKNVAKRYAPNHELALALFDSKIREMKICAVYVEDEKFITPEQVNKWSESFTSLEIAENCSSMLFYKADFALSIAESWMDSEDESKIYPALLIAGRRARFRYNEEDRSIYNKILSLALKYNDNKLIIKAVSNLIMSLMYSDENFKEEIANLNLSPELKSLIQ